MYMLTKIRLNQIFKVGIPDLDIVDGNQATARTVYRVIKCLFSSSNAIYGVQ